MKQISGRKIFLYFFSFELFMVIMKKRNEYQKYIYLGQNTSKYCSQINVVHDHANGFL